MKKLVLAAAVGVCALGGSAQAVAYRSLYFGSQFTAIIDLNVYAKVGPLQRSDVRSFSVNISTANISGGFVDSDGFLSVDPGTLTATPTDILFGNTPGVIDFINNVGNQEIRYTVDPTAGSVTRLLRINSVQQFDTLPIGSVFAPLAPSSVPEPSTWALMVIGFGGVGTIVRRRARHMAAA